MSFSSSQQVLYGIMVLVATTILMDKVMVIGVHQTQVMIVSPKYMEINDMLQEKLNRGSTLLEALTGRVKKPIKVIMTVVSNRQVPELHPPFGPKPAWGNPVPSRLQPPGCPLYGLWLLPYPFCLPCSG